MFDDIAINFRFSWNFANMKDIVRTCNPTVRFSKFILNINIWGVWKVSLQTSLERNFVQKLMEHENRTIDVGCIIKCYIKIKKVSFYVLK